MTLSGFWNNVGIVALAISATYNLAYFIRHENGKKLLRLFSGVLLLTLLVFRVLLLIGFVSDLEFSQLVRPWVGLVYLLPAADAFVDWQRKRKAIGYRT